MIYHFKRFYRLIKQKISYFKIKSIIRLIKKNVAEKPYESNVTYYFESTIPNTGVFEALSDKGKCGLAIIKYTPPLQTYKKLEAFTRLGGKLIYLPIWPGLPRANEVSMYSLIGYATRKPAHYLLKTNTINLTSTDFAPMGRFHPIQNIEKKYDFFIVTWAGDITHKRWDLVVKIIPKICEKYKMCVLAYKGTPSKKDLRIISKYEQKGNLKFINEFVPKDQFVTLLNSSKVMIIPNEWDNHSRIMDQALLCNVPLVVNKNIYGGVKLITNSTGVLSEPENLAIDAIQLLGRMKENLETRSWYLEQFGSYSSAIRFTKVINKIFNTDYKIIFDKDLKFIFKEEYIKKCAIPETISSYFKGIFNEKEQ